MSRFYFHCSDGVDLVLDREGVEIEASDVLGLALRAAARLISALPSYDDWSAWTVSVHDERGSLVETLPFPANTDRRDALHFEGGIERWAPHSPPHPHQTGSRRSRRKRSVWSAVREDARVAKSGVRPGALAARRGVKKGASDYHPDARVGYVQKIR